MGSNNIIVREYLESLKEDSELDYLFPILLVLMGFKIKSTPRHSKGSSQYGKDVVAVGSLSDGIKKRFYFELKGHSDKDIDDVTFNKKDGIRDSIQAAKDTPFTDQTDPEFNQLPIEIVTVHNGIVKEIFRPQFNGYILREFPNGGYQNWDIYALTDLFSKYLFSEYLLTDEESLRLFKKSLILLDAPENNYSDFKQLVDLQFESLQIIKGRALKKLFATLKLLSVIFYHYSKENNNLLPARECLTYLVLKAWSWILKNKLEEKRPIINEFKKLLLIHFDVLNEYFQKTLPVALTENGLYSERGGPFEEVGYPLRSFDYMNYLIYFFQVRGFWPKFSNPVPTKERTIFRRQKKILKTLLDKNDGCSRPLLDNHSIAILNAFLFILKSKYRTQADLNFIGGDYLVRILNNIMIIKSTRGRFPDLYSNSMVLTEYASTKTRPHNYEDRSSLLITILFELVALLNAEPIYKDFASHIKGKINLQTAYPNFKEHDIEQVLFEKHLHNEYYIEASIELNKELKKFKETIQNKKIESIEYRTDKVGFPFLRTLAHVYYKNELFPDEWRKLFPNIKSN